MNIVVLFALTVCKIHRRQPSWISRVVRFSVNHREAIVAKLVLSLTRLSFPLVRQYQLRSCPPPLPPPGANPRAFDLFENLWSNAWLCGQKTRSNAPPVGQRPISHSLNEEFVNSSLKNATEVHHIVSRAWFRVKCPAM